MNSFEFIYMIVVLSVIWLFAQCLVYITVKLQSMVHKPYGWYSNDNKSEIIVSFTVPGSRHRHGLKRISLTFLQSNDVWLCREFVDRIYMKWFPIISMCLFAIGIPVVYVCNLSTDISNLIALGFAILFVSSLACTYYCSINSVATKWLNHNIDLIQVK